MTQNDPLCSKYVIARSHYSCAHDWRTGSEQAALRYHRVWLSCAPLFTKDARPPHVTSYDHTLSDFPRFDGRARVSRPAMQETVWKQPIETVALRHAYPGWVAARLCMRLRFSQPCRRQRDSAWWMMTTPRPSPFLQKLFTTLRNVADFLEFWKQQTSPLVWSPHRYLFAHRSFPPPLGYHFHIVVTWACIQTGESDRGHI